MDYKVGEESANALSHGLGILFAILALPFLKADFSIYIYGLSFLFLFSSSTAYHLAKKSRRKKNLQKVDHVSIYFMIAGSYTPFVFQCLSENNAWLFFSFLWGIVILGTIFKLFFTGRFDKLSLILYLSMGWMVVFIAKPFIDSFDLTTVLMVALGGLFYTGGVYFYSNDHKPYFHFIWHLFVLAGAVTHYFAIASV